jgi:hypothetical protein
VKGSETQQEVSGKREISKKMKEHHVVLLHCVLSLKRWFSSIVSPISPEKEL